MSDFVFITCNDIHISDNGPRSRVDNFKETMLNKISQMRVACIKLNADAALITGDIYNLKNPAQNTHELNNDLISEFKKFPCPIYAIEGNHDLTKNNLDSIKKQPLGVLFADGTLKQLRHEIIEKDNYKVSLVGIPFQQDLDPNKIKIPPKEDCIAGICLLHAYASPTSGMLFKERLYSYKEFSHLDADIFVFGHYHIDQGIENIDGKYFVNIGSMSRGTLSDEDIDHHPQIGLIRINTDNDISINIQSIKLKVKPAEEIFNIDKYNESKEESKEMEQFINKLITETSEDMSENKDFNDVIKNFNVAKAVKEKALFFLQEAGATR